MYTEELEKRLDGLTEKESPAIVAIDGSCASGKTTLAAVLAEKYECNLIHMDDFFLRPEQRTPERLAQPGGNVDYERFREEVLQPLRRGEAFSYRPYCCAIGALGEEIRVEPRKLTIVEGSYSMHPYFGEIYDLKIFLTVEPQVRMQRILQRPKHLHQAFFEKWIPMEQQYFAAFSIADNCDLIL